MVFQELQSCIGDEPISAIAIFATELNMMQLDDIHMNE